MRRWGQMMFHRAQADTQRLRLRRSAVSDQDQNRKVVSSQDGIDTAGSPGGGTRTATVCSLTTRLTAVCVHRRINKQARPLKLSIPLRLRL